MAGCQRLRAAESGSAQIKQKNKDVAGLQAQFCVSATCSAAGARRTMAGVLNAASVVGVSTMRVLVVVCVVAVLLPGTTAFHEVEQREGLLALFTATDGANWNRNAGWGSSDSECTWEGVVCNSDGWVSQVRRGIVGRHRFQTNSMTRHARLDLAALECQQFVRHNPEQVLARNAVLA